MSMGKRELATRTEVCHILVENEDADLYGVSKAKTRAKHHRERVRKLKELMSEGGSVFDELKTARAHGETVFREMNSSTFTSSDLRL